MRVSEFSEVQKVLDFWDLTKDLSSQSESTKVWLETIILGE